MVNTWVDGYGCPGCYFVQPIGFLSQNSELHSTSIPAVNQHINTLSNQHINNRDNHWSTRGLTATVAPNGNSSNQFGLSPRNSECHSTSNPAVSAPADTAPHHWLLIGTSVHWYIGTLVHQHINQHINTLTHQHINQPSSSLSPAHLLRQLPPCSQFRERMNLIVKYVQNVSYPIKLVQ